MATVAGAAMTIAIGTFCSIAINAVKAIVVAKYFGTGPDLDAFFIALIPPMVLSGILTASMQSSLIPTLIDRASQGRDEEGDRTFRSFFTLSLVTLILTSAAMILFSNSLVSWIAPGFRGEQRLLASRILKLVAPTLFIGGAADIIGALFNARKRFFVPAFGGAANVAVSLLCLVLFRDLGIHALVVGSLAGSAAQLAFLAAGAGAAGLKIGMSLDFGSEGTRHVLRMMAPMVLGATFSNINIAVDQIMASTLPAGSVSALNYANSMNSIFIQLFIFSIGSAILPFFSQQISEGKIEGLKSTFSLAARMGLFILVPITVFTFVIGTPLVRGIFQRGAFDASSTHAVSGALKAFVLGLSAMSIGITAVKVFTSLRMTKLLAAIAFVNVFVNVTLNAVLMRPLGHVGIALSTSITYACSTGLLLHFMTRRLGRLDFREILLPGSRILAISLVCGAIVYAVRLSYAGDSLLSVLLLGTLGLSLYAFLSRVGNVEEFRILLGQSSPR